MESIQGIEWNLRLHDPSGRRLKKPRKSGLTMVIDKGLGLTAFRDMLQTCSDYIDIIKLGFGTAVLYPHEVLTAKIRHCREHGITVLPGGTFLEVAVLQDKIEVWLETIRNLGFDGIEVSDGTIEMDANLRKDLILRGKSLGLKVFTEYGKKCWGSKLELEELMCTIQADLLYGAELVTIEGRESGKGVGIYDEQGHCQQDLLAEVLAKLPDPNVLLWEAPLKSQQVELINRLGPKTNLGNIPPDDVLSLEALRRGLRSDTLLSLVGES